MRSRRIWREGGLEKKASRAWEKLETKRRFAPSPIGCFVPRTLITFLGNKKKQAIELGAKQTERFSTRAVSLVLLAQANLDHPELFLSAQPAVMAPRQT